MYIFKFALQTKYNTIMLFHGVLYCCKQCKVYYYIWSLILIDGIDVVLKKEKLTFDDLQQHLDIPYVQLKL